jgi:hypothetical protein
VELEKKGGLFYLLLFTFCGSWMIFSLLSSPLHILANNCDDLESLLVQNESNINNAIKRFYEFKGRYPKKMEELVEKGGDVTFLRYIPYNPEDDNYNWQVIKKDGFLIGVTARFDGKFEGEYLFELVKKVVEFKNYLFLFLLIGVGLYLVGVYYDSDFMSYMGAISIFFLTILLVLSVGKIYSLEITGMTFL